MISELLCVMMNSEEAKTYIENSRHALEHLFSAINEYNKLLAAAQKDVEDIENSKRVLSDLFMYRDQWSPNANHHYAQYMQRMAHLAELQKDSHGNHAIRLESAQGRISATVESISSLAGAVLQLAKQVMSLRYSGKPNLEFEKMIGSQKITAVSWEGRNHAMHWDEGEPKTKVRDMLDRLSKDLGITIEPGRNNCLSILGALNWSSTDVVVKDLNAII